MASRQWWSPPTSNSEQDLHEWTLRMWRRMDRDGSGSLTRQELDCEEFYTIVRAVLLPPRQASAGMGGPGYARAVMDMSQAIDFALRKADINNDGKLSFDEFKSFILVLRKPQLATHTANLIFALFDANRDAWIDESEFRQIWRFYLGKAPTETDFQQEWIQLDRANRGRVNREDYVKWLQTSINPVFRDHAPQPSSTVMSGSSDYHLAKKELLATAPAQTAVSSQVQPWRPWHAYSNLAWAQVRQGGAIEGATERAKSMSSTGGFSQGSPATTGGFCRGSPASSCMSATGGLAKERITRSAGSLADRPRPPWNQRLAVANANWPDLNGKPRRPKGMRDFMSTPQSPSELTAHFTLKVAESPSSSRRGFQRSLTNLQLPEKRFTKQSKYSHDRIEVRSSPELLPARSKFKYGRNKNSQTGEREYWEDNWRSPPQLKDKYVNGTNDFRSLGAPPRYMYVDEYEDPP